MCVEPKGFAARTSQPKLNVSIVFTREKNGPCKQGEQETDVWMRMHYVMQSPPAPYTTRIIVECLSLTIQYQASRHSACEKRVVSNNHPGTQEEKEQTNSRQNSELLIQACL